MKKLMLLVVMLPFYVFSQEASDTLPSATRRAVATISADQIKGPMVFLSADEMQGRNTGSHEGRIAANYIASEFMRSGLKPAGDNGTYFQDFNLVTAWIDRENTALKVAIGGFEKSYQIDHDFSFWVMQSNNPAQAIGPLTFLGYGIDANEYSYNDFAGVDLHGKIAMILQREPQENNSKSKFKGSWNTFHAYEWFKAEQIRKAGAAGLLIIKKRNPGRAQNVSSGPHPGNVAPLSHYALAGRLWDFPIFSVTSDVADDLLAGTGQSVESLEQEIDRSYQPHSFEVPGVTLTMKKALKDQKVIQGRNVLGLLEGTDPALRNETVLISGHYDHLGVVGDRIYHGADDNASGTTGVLEIAKAYSLGALTSRRTILFVAFDAEERPMLGSYFYVEHPVIPLENTIADLNMDMIGRDEQTETWHTTAEQNKNDVNIVGTLYDPDLRRIIEDSDKTIGLKLDFKTDNRDPEAWFARSDQFWFAIRHIPMVLFTTGEHPDYHTENDTWDRIDYRKMEKIIQLVFLTSVELADSRQKPKFVP